eukprot:scaffold653620_cov53-Prasinocladus_malaysianus.AAC.1
MDPSTAAGLLARARPLGMQSYHFTRSQQAFEPDDFHGYDLLIALDTDVEARLLDQAVREAQWDKESPYFKYLKRKVSRLEHHLALQRRDTKAVFRALHDFYDTYLCTLFQMYQTVLSMTLVPR